MKFMALLLLVSVSLCAMEPMLRPDLRQGFGGLTQGYAGLGPAKEHKELKRKLVTATLQDPNVDISTLKLCYHQAWWQPLRLVRRKDTYNDLVEALLERDASISEDSLEQTIEWSADKNLQSILRHLIKRNIPLDPFLEYRSLLSGHVDPHCYFLAKRALGLSCACLELFIAAEMKNKGDNNHESVLHMLNHKDKNDGSFLYIAIKRFKDNAKELKKLWKEKYEAKHTHICKEKKQACQQFMNELRFEDLELLLTSGIIPYILQTPDEPIVVTQVAACARFLEKLQDPSDNTRLPSMIRYIPTISPKVVNIKKKIEEAKKPYAESKKKIAYLIALGGLYLRPERWEGTTKLDMQMSMLHQPDALLSRELEFVKHCFDTVPNLPVVRELIRNKSENSHLSLLPSDLIHPLHQFMMGQEFPRLSNSFQ